MKVFLLIGDRLAYFTEAIARFHNVIVQFREATERLRDGLREWMRNMLEEEFTIVVRVVPRNMFLQTNTITPGGVWQFPDMRAHKRQRHPRWNGG
jgi:hypothetical protein